MFMPKTDTYLIIELPGEKLRAFVRKILTPNKIVLQLLNVPLGKSHNYKKDDYVACKRVQGMFGESWEAIEAKPTLDDFMENINVKRLNSGTLRKKRKKPGNKI